MDKTAEVYEFCLAWVMGYDDIGTLEMWFKELSIDFQDLREIAKSQNWWVKSMEQIEKW